MEFQELSKRIRHLQDDFLLLSNERRRLLEEQDRLESDRNATLHNIDVRMQAIDFIEGVAETERKAVKERVESLVTECLHEVYGDSYSVEFDYGVKGNRTSVEISIVRKCDDGICVKREIDGIGGGVADTVSLPLKLIVLLNDGEFDRVLVADEPGKHLDTTRVLKFAKLLRDISHRLGIQIIMSSHHAIMKDYADTVWEVQLDDSVSKVVRKK